MTRSHLSRLYITETKGREAKIPATVTKSACEAISQLVSRDIDSASDTELVQIFVYVSEVLCCACVPDRVKNRHDSRVGAFPLLRFALDKCSQGRDPFYAYKKK